MIDTNAIIREQTRKAEQGLRRLSRDVYHIQRRVGLSEGFGKEEAEAAAVAFQGFGPYFYDYLVDDSYAGAEGAVMTTFHGQIYKVYKDLQNAITDAQLTQIADPNTTCKSFGIAEGDYGNVIINDDSTLGFPGGINSGMHLHFYGVGQKGGLNQTRIGSVVAGDALTIAENQPTYFFHNINFQGQAGYSLKCDPAGGINYSVFFEHCFFAYKLAGDFAGAGFVDCEFAGAGYVIIPGDDPATVHFSGCKFNLSTRMQWEGSSQDHWFNDCEFIGLNSAFDIIAGSGLDLNMTGCDFGSVAKNSIKIDGVGSVTGGVSLVGCHFPPPVAGAPTIWYKAFNDDSVVGRQIVGNTFDRDPAGVVNEAYIKADMTPHGVNNHIFAGNSFGRDNAGNYLEDVSSRASIEGWFEDSVFGPNAPGGIVEYNIDTTSGNNEFYPQAAAVGGSVPVRGAAGVTAMWASALEVNG